MPELDSLEADVRQPSTPITAAKMSGLRREPTERSGRQGDIAQIEQRGLPNEQHADSGEHAGDERFRHGAL